MSAFLAVKKIKHRHPHSPPLGSTAWVEERIHIAHSNIYRPPVSPWVLEKARAVAELNFENLGLKIEGAPDTHPSVANREYWAQQFGREQDIYPPRISYFPHYLRETRNLPCKDFLIWTFLVACEKEQLPISPAASKWLEWVDTRDLWLESYKVTQVFHRPTHPVLYNTETTLALKQAKIKFGTTNPIEQVKFESPVKLQALNNSVWDWRPIPTTEEGEPIDKLFIKKYLEQRLLEWLALGGFYWHKAEYFYYLVFSDKGKGPPCTFRFVRNFYWDLWEDLENLRWQYKQANSSALQIQEWWNYCSLKLAKERLLAQQEEEEYNFDFVF